MMRMATFDAVLCLRSLFILVVLLIPSVSPLCMHCPHQTKATYFASNPPLSRGSCGYGSLAPEFSNGYLAAGAPSVYRDGVGCGACFKVKCLDPKICSRTGTKFILTDSINTSSSTSSSSSKNATSNGNHDLVLSSKVFLGMAHKGLGHAILKQKVVDVEYERIACEYKKHNLSVRVEETSDSSKNRLVLTFLYQGGQTDIMSIDTIQIETTRQGFLSQRHGPVWETDQLPFPAAALKFRLVVKAGFDWEMATTTTPFPADWKVGQTYDLGIQLAQVCIEPGCTPCDP